MERGSRNSFWHPPLWKWTLFALLIAGLCVMAPWRMFSPFPSPPVKVELLPFTDSPPAWDGSYPYLVISSTTGAGPPKFESSISSIKPTARHDSPVNEFLVDLHTGRFVLRQTDLFVSDVMPLSLTRTYITWDYHSRAFGVGTNHPYDICPTGTRRPYTYMDLNLEDFYQVHMARISKGTGYADAVFRHGETSSEFYGAQVAWNGNGWTLDFRDGRKMLFPEAYGAKTYAQGAAIEMRDAEGHRIQLKRDPKRNLQELISPAGHAIAFKYDFLDRIVEADDHAGDVRKYSYEFGHLQTISDNARVLYRFEYQILLRAAGYDPYLMTGIRDGSGKELLRNWYADGSRVSLQKLADGRTYRYHYLLNGKNDVVETVVTLPDRTQKRFFFESGILIKEK